MKLAANLTMMFTEYEFVGRFGMAASTGFSAVECLFPYELEAQMIADILDEKNLTFALFNAPPGDWDGGDRGLAAVPGRESEFREALDILEPYVATVQPRNVHIMAGLADATDLAAHQTFQRNLQVALEMMSPYEVPLLIEPINPRDMPGYFLNDFGMARDIISSMQNERLKLQFDIYHRQIIRGDVIRGIEAMADIIGHVQIAGVPERNEPDVGELDYAQIFTALAATGYDGFIGCEYRPKGETEFGLGWRKKLLPNG